VRLGAIAETPLEWLGLRLARVPTPLIDTHLAFAQARTIMVAVRVGVFEALTGGAGTPEEVARACGLAEVPSRRLLYALVGIGYLVPGRTPGSVALSPVARRWLVRGSPYDVIDKVLFSFDEWRLVEGYEAFVRGEGPVGLHGAAAGAAAARTAHEPSPNLDRAPSDDVDAEAWARYQRGLRAVAVVSVDEVARRTPVPRGARRLLDLGGGHGRFAAALVRRHPGLRATVVDLPPAVAASAADLAAEGLGDRLVHRAADVLHEPLGDADVDVVLASQLNHHLGEDDNRLLANRVAAALRLGGVYVIQDLARPRDPREAQRARLGALLDLYFGATSDGGTYTIPEMRAWQTSAGLRPQAARWLRTLPGLVQQVAVRR
jgi:cyclopropane fatty-acyl-phospholipid synthase-like methyltransferase